MAAVKLIGQWSGLSPQPELDDRCDRIGCGALQIHRQSFSCLALDVELTTWLGQERTTHDLVVDGHGELAVGRPVEDVQVERRVIAVDFLGDPTPVGCETGLAVVP